MPGLIESKDYAAAKERLVTTTVGAVDALDAIEWSLLNATFADLRHFPVVQLPGMVQQGHQEGHDPHYRSIMVGASRGRPSLIAVFTTELFDGENKVLLLDVWLNLDGEDDEDAESDDGG